MKAGSMGSMLACPVGMNDASANSMVGPIPDDISAVVSAPARDIQE